MLVVPIAHTLVGMCRSRVECVAYGMHVSSEFSSCMSSHDSVYVVYDGSVYVEDLLVRCL